VGGGLRFLIARSVEHRETAAALERFGAQLSHQTGEPVRVELVPTYAELRVALAAGKAQLAWVPPILLAETNDERMVPLVTAERDGSIEYCSVLFVRADSPLHTLADLRGSTVAWVDRYSAAGYLLPRMHLVAEGRRPERLFGRELFLTSHGNVVRAVFAGEADVGATYGGPPGSSDESRSGYAHVDPQVPVRILFRSSAVPADAVVCDARLSPATRLHVTAALLHLGTFAIGRRVTRLLFGADGFVTHDPQALSSLRTLVAGARARGWLPPQ
jgi:phosphate/phosphite/phosphonate ABC transporter binding protein